VTAAACWKDLLCRAGLQVLPNALVNPRRRPCSPMLPCAIGFTPPVPAYIWFDTNPITTTVLLDGCCGTKFVQDLHSLVLRGQHDCVADVGERVGWVQREFETPCVLPCVWHFSEPITIICISLRTSHFVCSSPTPREIFFFFFLSQQPLFRKTRTFPPPGTCPGS